MEEVNDTGFGSASFRTRMGFDGVIPVPQTHELNA